MSADQRVVQVPTKALEQIATALQGALRLSVAHDQLDAAKDARDTPGVSKLTTQLGAALQLTRLTVQDAAPAERADLHVYPVEQLTPEFVRQLMLDRGWQSGQLVVGSAQGETMARRLLHQLPGVALAPLSGGRHTEDPNTWMLVEG